MTVGVIDYGMGNTGSVLGALDALSIRGILSTDPAVLRTADRLILPGVGAYAAGMAALRARGLDVFLRETAQPLLGICLGFQLMTARGDEGGETEGLGLFPFAETVRLDRMRMGWEVTPCGAMYFAHHYGVVEPYKGDVLRRGWTGRDERHAQLLTYRRYVGLQCHPEKSGAAGMRWLYEWTHGAVLLGAPHPYREASI